MRPLSMLISLLLTMLYLTQKITKYIDLFGFTFVFKNKVEREDFSNNILKTSNSFSSLLKTKT